jgi:hypothetical protein
LKVWLAIRSNKGPDREFAGNPFACAFFCLQNLAVTPALRKEASRPQIDLGPIQALAVAGEVQVLEERFQPGLDGAFAAHGAAVAGAMPASL